MGNICCYKKCHICNDNLGNKLGFRVYHLGNLGGYLLCYNCYSKHNRLCIKFKNKSKKKATCEYCHHKIEDINSKPIYKIYYNYKKFDKTLICEDCLHNKSNRIKNII